MKYRFHLLCLAHLPQSKEYVSCAYTQKNIKLSKMLLDLGHDVICYASEGSDIECTEFVETHSIKDIQYDYSDGDNRFEIGYDWTSVGFKADFSTPSLQSTIKFRKTCIDKIQKSKNHNDFLLCSQGIFHKPIADEVKLFLTCEPGIGYTGSVPSWYRAFESSSWQHFAYGSEKPFQSVTGSYYDRVIPNYFNNSDILYSEDKKDYYLYIGRIIKRKGVATAVFACDAAKQKLIIAGQGAKLHDGHLRSQTNDLQLAPGTWEYVGYADVEKRKKLFAHAIATFVPTEYLEPFAGVHIESMLSGTPVITTSFGVFNETIPDIMDGIIGFKCNTLDDFAKAALRCKGLDPKPIRKYAEQFLVDNVKYKFQKWFDDLYEVYLSAYFGGRGWMTIHEN